MNERILYEAANLRGGVSLRWGGGVTPATPTGVSAGGQTPTPEVSAGFSPRSFKAFWSAVPGEGVRSTRPRGDRTLVALGFTVLPWRPSARHHRRSPLFVAETRGCNGNESQGSA